MLWLSPKVIRDSGNQTLSRDPEDPQQPSAISTHSARTTPATVTSAHRVSTCESGTALSTLSVPYSDRDQTTTHHPAELVHRTIIKTGLDRTASTIGLYYTPHNHQDRVRPHSLNDRVVFSTVWIDCVPHNHRTGLDRTVLGTITQSTNSPT